MDAQAWEKVDALIDANQNKTIKDYFAEDPDRAKKFSLEAAGWFLDYSKNRFDAPTLKALPIGSIYQFIIGPAGSCSHSLKYPFGDLCNDFIGNTVDNIHILALDHNSDKRLSAGKPYKHAAILTHLALLKSNKICDLFV